MEDLQIVQLYWDRDQQAIACSKEKYGIYCFTVANHILDNFQDSEECVSDTWLSAWNAMPPYRPQVLRMFFAKITRRLAFNRFKANSAQKRGGGQLPLVLEELSQCVAGSEDLDGALVAKELGTCIRNFVEQLPPREGDVFVRRYFFTEPVKEIAQKYGLTENHVSVILNRTRNKLKDHLQKEGYL